jgi:hypothetical protein
MTPDVLSQKWEYTPIDHRSCNNRRSLGWTCSVSLLAVIFLVCFAAALLAPSAYGQAEQATITGLVTDPTGAIVPNAKVTAREVSTQTVSATVTNSSGNYTIPFLAPGTYDISAGAPGFKTIVESGVLLTVNLATTVNLKLSTGEVSQQVTVAANALQLETENSELGGSFSQQQIIELPGSGGYNLDLLSPGVVPVGTSNAPLQASVNGGMAITTNLLLDGGLQLNSSTGDPGYTPPTESLREYKLVTSNFDAQYGMSGGGVITATSMSGTNKFHGAFYEYLKNTIFNANGWYRNSVNLPRGAVHDNQFGFAIGGPVLLPHLYNGRNRTFFFLNIEWNPNKSPDAFTGTVPTVAMRTGDFSGLVDAKGNPIKIYDPLTTKLVPGTTNTYTRSQFSYKGVANVIDPGRINDIAAKALTYYPLPNAPGVAGIYNNYVASPARVTTSNNTFARVDQNIGASHKAFLRIGRFATTATTQTPTIAYWTGNNNGDPGTLLRNVWSGAASDTWTIRPNLLMEMRGNFIHLFLRTQVASQGFNAGDLGFSSTSGFPGHVAAPIFPNFTVSDSGSLGNGASAFFTDAEGSYEGQDHVIWVKGSHTVKVGFDYIFVFFNEYRPTWPAGTFNFSRGFTQGPNPVTASTNAGWGFASFLLGLPGGGQITQDPSITASQKNFDTYLNDDWKLTRKLTLNLGVRHDILTGFTDRYNKFAWFDPKAPDTVLGLPGSLVFAGVNGNRRNQSPTAYGNFSPRVGFAYALNEKTVVRGGYGFIYTTNSGGSVTNSGWAAGTNVYLGAAPAAPNTPPTGNLDNPFTAGYISAPSYLVGGNVNAPFNSSTLPLLQYRSLSIERQLSRTTILQLAYMGWRTSLVQPEHECCSHRGPELRFPAYDAGDESKCWKVTRGSRRKDNLVRPDTRSLSAIHRPQLDS